MSELIKNLLQEERLLYKELSYQLVGMAMRVHRELGPGFLERVYENALAILLRREGIAFQTQHPVKVYFDGELVGDYYTDIIVDNNVILELKASDTVSPAHKAQAINYLKATGIQLAIIINFGSSSLQYERVINHKGLRDDSSNL